MDRSVIRRAPSKGRLRGWLSALGRRVRGRRPLFGGFFSKGVAGGAATPEEELVKRAKEGGPAGKAAFSRLVERHHTWLVRYLYFLLGGSSDAEDIAQEALVRAFLAMDRFRGESGFRTWLRPIATRLAFNHRRDAATRQKYEDMLDMPDHRMSDEMSVVSKDALLKVLAELSYPYREILVLRYVEELAIKDISLNLNIGLSAAKMRLARAREGFWDIYRRMASDG